MPSDTLRPQFLVSHQCSGPLLLSAEADGCVDIWSVKLNNLHYTLTHTSAVICLANDDARAFTASGNAVKMWHIRSGEAAWEVWVGDQVWPLVWQQGILIVASFDVTVASYKASQLTLK